MEKTEDGKVCSTIMIHEENERVFRKYAFETSPDKIWGCKRQENPVVYLIMYFANEGELLVDKIELDEEDRQGEDADQEIDEMGNEKRELMKSDARVAVNGIDEIVNSSIRVSTKKTFFNHEDVDVVVNNASTSEAFIAYRTSGCEQILIHRTGTKKYKTASILNAEAYLSDNTTKLMTLVPKAEVVSLHLDGCDGNMLLREPSSNIEFPSLVHVSPMMSQDLSLIHI
eukprot:TRINITY_DN17448_c0_g1_i1.p2 TRINITY_DN17448_c0_g1~~TRINITY_DN17448_c0_g1_i1.p2  ORF type:complete len:228 (-),score=27.52 TRINITY_DN17448_c0_g1_i1:60-743(-)